MYKFKVGAKVKTQKTIVFGYGSIPAGALATVISRFKGYELVTDACPHCGVKIRISRVQESSLEEAW